jgi:membrane protease YdiL (CAAX protease family)
VSHEPPGTLRVTLLMARMSLKRWFNRFALRRKKKSKPGERTATGRKTGRPAAIMIFVGVIFLMQAVLISSQFVSRIAGEIEEVRKPPAAEALESDEDAPADLNEPIGLGGEPTGVEDLDWRERNDRFRAWPTTEGWVDAEHESALLGALAIALALLVAAAFFNSIGGTSQELSQVGWAMEWLFTFPVRSRALFLARFGEYTLTNVFGWFTLLPLSFVIFFNAGFSWVAVPMALWTTLCLNALAASGRVLAETWLRKNLGLQQLKNVRALCTLAGMVSFFAAFYIAYAQTLPGFVVHLFAHPPAGIMLTPFGAPLLMIPHFWGVFAMTGWALVFVFVAVRGSATMVRDGLVIEGGAQRGSDRNYLVQTLVTPLVLIGLQLVMNPKLFSGEGGTTTTSIVAFGIGAYVLMFGAFAVLAVEREALWLLFTFPQPLAGILRRKVILWACIAAVYCGVALALMYRPGPDPSAAVLVAPFMAMGGIFLFAFLAAGLGCLGTDPQEQIAQRRVRPVWAFLYMTLASMYGYAIFAPSVWLKFVIVIQMILLTYAIWQKVHERLPLLLDPTQSPAPSISLADGLIAMLVFFVLQSLFALPMIGDGGYSLAFVLLIAFSCAGLLTMLLMTLVFVRAKVPDLWQTLGFLRPRVSNLVLGALAGLGCAGVAAGYLLLLDSWAPLRALKEQAMDSSLFGRDTSAAPIAVLAIVAAPIFEEFLFRGLVFQGLARTVPLRWAVIGSATLFAIIHPPISFPAVFALGVAAAIVFHRTRSFWAAVTVHAVYNAAVVLVLSRFL